MSIAEGLKAALAADLELDRQLARRIGEHIDHQAKGLAELRDTVEAKAFAPEAFRTLPAANREQFQSLKVTELKAIATRMALPGRSKPKRKVEIIQFLIDHNAPLAPSYEQLLAFWVDQQVNSTT